VAIIDPDLDTLELPLVMPPIDSDRHIVLSDDANAEVEDDVRPHAVAVAAVVERYFEQSGVLVVGKQPRLVVRDTHSIQIESVGSNTTTHTLRMRNSESDSKGL
jgi:hypothetical protein